MTVNVIGLGYIGLPTALSLAAGGQRVVGTDKNGALLKQLAAGDVTFEEKGLPELFLRAKESGNLSFSTRCAEADIYIVAIRATHQVEVTE